MTDAPNKMPPAPRRPTGIGIGTTTPIAFAAGGEVYLERMNVLSEEGCGVLTQEQFDVGSVLSIAFHLSTAASAIRCKAQVLGNLPTTPAGFDLQLKLGDRATPAIINAGVSDSATAIFRLGDLQRPQAAPSNNAAAAAQAVGLCLRFVRLDQQGREAVRHHITNSRKLLQQLAAQGGRSLAAERPAIADSFVDGDLSTRALDW